MKKKMGDKNKQILLFSDKHAALKRHNISEKYTEAVFLPAYCTNQLHTNFRFGHHLCIQRQL
jgi:flagellar biosynthesis protein FliP